MNRISVISGMSLASRFEAIAARWPVIPERAGRDLGEYVKKKYAKRFLEMLQGPREQVRLHWSARPAHMS